MFRRIRVSLSLIAALTASFATGASPAGASEVRGITLPIAPEYASQVHWTDTFGAPRSGGRSHLGVDMMGAKMIPLVAVADGTVSWLRHSDSRGNNLNITDADGWTYYYIHINNDTPGTDDGVNDYDLAFAPGIVEGATVVAGQVVAYMGDSGNAEWTGSHLHFEITRPDGTNINPTPSVDAALESVGLGSILDQLDGYDTDQIQAAVSELGDSLIGRPLTAEERSQLYADIAANGLGATLTEWVGVDSRAASIDRLYKAFFLRLPDADGLRYWIETNESGCNLNELADVFAQSDEYQLRYPDMSFQDFLDQLYLEVLNREPDVSGRDYWLDELEHGRVTKGTIVVEFTESRELRNLTGRRSEVIAMTSLLEGRMPTDEEVSDWEAMRSTVGLAEAIETLFALDI